MVLIEPTGRSLGSVELGVSIGRHPDSVGQKELTVGLEPV